MEIFVYFGLVTVAFIIGIQTDRIIAELRSIAAELQESNASARRSRTGRKSRCR